MSYYRFNTFGLVNWFNKVGNIGLWEIYEEANHWEFFFLTDLYVKENAMWLLTFKKEVQTTLNPTAWS